MIKLSKAVKIYNEGNPNETAALGGIDLTVKKGEMLAVMGPSGSGKSTLLNIIGVMDTLTRGSYELDGEDVGRFTQSQLARLRNKRFGFVLQDFGLLADRSAGDNIVVPLLFGQEKLRSSSARIKPLAEQLGISELLGRPVSQLSGGQAQRVAIARAMVNDPDVILADEPTGALDSVTANGVMEVFRKLNAAGKTVIIATHDKMVGDACERMCVLHDGKIV